MASRSGAPGMHGSGSKRRRRACGTGHIDSMAPLRRHHLCQRVSLVPVQPDQRREGRFCRGSAGPPMVWTTCLVFFQTTLLLGYALRRPDRASARPASTQVRLHVTLLALSHRRCRSYSGAQWKPLGSESPSLLILGLARAQRSACRIFCCRRPARWCRHGLRAVSRAAVLYRLFALSNLASMLALLGYPIATRAVGHDAICSRTDGPPPMSCSRSALLRPADGSLSLRSRHRADVHRTSTAGCLRPDDAPPEPIDSCCGRARGDGRFCFCCSRCTNHIVSEHRVDPAPVVVPLSIYLLTFILCFDGRGWYRAASFLLAMLAAGLGVMA